MTDRSLAGQSLWDLHAKADPLWAVLSFPDKRGRWNLQDFMKTGEREIALLFHRFAELQLPQPHGRALDFGCGVGRLTQALARRVDRVAGADISPVMIGLAERLNQYPDRAEYLCTAERGLESQAPASFDLIYCNIVLQHVPAEASVRYLHEFFRVLAPNGLLVFQLPSHRDSMGEAEIKSMPDAAYSAAIELESVPRVVAASAEFAITMRVRNASEHTWRQPAVGPLAVGNHWLDAAGELMLIQDDGRAPLLQVVTPGLEWPVLMKMRAPREPGSYIVEIDLVHEGISWFAHKGSPTLRFPIEVTRTDTVVDSSPAAMIKEYPLPVYPEDVVPAPPSTDSESLLDKDFPMDGVPREQVMEIIAAHGGRLAYLEEDRRAGPEWVSYRYFVVGRS